MLKERLKGTIPRNQQELKVAAVEAWRASPEKIISTR